MLLSPAGALPSAPVCSSPAFIPQPGQFSYGECIPDMRKLEFMLVPRIYALAEAARIRQEKRPGESHLGERIHHHYTWFDEQKINFRQEDGTPRLFPEARK